MYQLRRLLSRAPAWELAHASIWTRCLGTPGPGRAGRPFRGNLLLLKLTDRLVGVRVSAEDEIAGLDLSQHGEVAYPSTMEG